MDFKNIDEFEQTIQNPLRDILLQIRNLNNKSIEKNKISGRYNDFFIKNDIKEVIKRIKFHRIC